MSVIAYDRRVSPIEGLAADDPLEDMQRRRAERVAELQAKCRLTDAEREELAILSYTGPAARRVAASDEVPF